jgi:hypothetical protein
MKNFLWWLHTKLKQLRWTIKMLQWSVEDWFAGRR